MEYIFIFIILIFSIIIHEVSHGAAALAMGDPTAKNAGRLTLNPINHIDPIGSIVLPLFFFLASTIGAGGIIFGWAKPVPVNPLNFKDKRYGEVKVSFAGPGSNIAIALIFGLALRFFPDILSIFPQTAAMFSYVVWINLQLAIFNLMPIPPLDGSHILFGLLPSSFYHLRQALQQYGYLLLLVVIFFFLPVIIYIISFIFFLITGFFLF